MDRPSKNEKQDHVPLLVRIVDNLVENNEKDITLLKEFKSTFPIFSELVDKNSEHAALAQWLVNKNDHDDYLKSAGTLNTLFKLVRSGNTQFVKYLFSLGVDINLTNESNVTALTIACEANDYKMVEYLLSIKDIDFTSSNIIDINPIQAAANRIAHEDGDERILKALLNKYKNQSIMPSSELLTDVAIRLHHGPSYIEDAYKEDVLQILGQTINYPLNTNSEEISW